MRQEKNNRRRQKASQGTTSSRHKWKGFQVEIEYQREHNIIYTYKLHSCSKNVMLMNQNVTYDVQSN